jgi:hypothetical protein
MSHGSKGEGERREEATTVAFIGHGFRDGEGREELSVLPREPAKATCRRRKAPRNRPPSAARSRALWLRWKMAYERSQAEGVVLPLAGQAGGGEKRAKHENGLPGAQPSPRATFPNTPYVSSSWSHSRQVTTASSLVGGVGRPSKHSLLAKKPKEY